jgi:exodeoxyribonuclease-3
MLQELKASPEKIPEMLFAMEGYWSFWHGSGGYSGVSIHVRRELCAESPAFTHPDFDLETRIVCSELSGTALASVYVPNGNKNYEAKVLFLQSLERWVGERRGAGVPVLLCGDLNVARTERDVHPKERKPGAIGQRPEERELLERIIATGGLVDVGRALDPDNDNLFTWWAPWRNLRQRNIGWRLDYVLASESLASRARSCLVYREFGTSDHGPVQAIFD